MGIIVLLFFYSIAICLFALWIYALVDVISANFPESNSKIIWLLLIVLLPFVGTVLYFMIGRKQKMVDSIV